MPSSRLALAGAATLLALASGFTLPPYSSAAAAPSPAPAPSARAVSPSPRRSNALRIIGVDSYTLTVMNLDRSFAFYRDVVGLPVLLAPSRPAANRANERLTDTPGAQLRSATFRIPGSSVVLVLSEFTHVERRSERPRIVDPGAVTLLVSVRDLAPVLAAAARSATHILTRGGEPLALAEGTRALVLLDPDGFYLQIRQSAPGATPPAASPGGIATSGNVINAAIAYSVAEPSTVQNFYHNVLGFNISSGAFVLDPSLDALLDAPGARLDVMPVSAASSGEPLQFVAFRGVARRTYLCRPQDPGAATVGLSVADLSVALRRIRSSGAIVVSAGGQPVTTARGARSILVRDPAGVLLQLVQRS